MSFPIDGIRMQKSNSNDVKHEKEREMNPAKWAIHFKSMNATSVRLGFLNNLE
jgi:hypothetical protein